MRRLRSWSTEEALRRLHGVFMESGRINATVCLDMLSTIHTNRCDVE